MFADFRYTLLNTIISNDNTMCNDVTVYRKVKKGIAYGVETEVAQRLRKSSEPVPSNGPPILSGSTGRAKSKK